MRTRLARLLFVAVTGWALLPGCPDQVDRTGKPDGGNEEFAKIRITDEAKGLLFTYLLADGSFETVDSIDKVPKEARDQVIVVDTKLSPEKRRSSQVIYVADLSSPRDDGTYPYSLVSRYKFERDLLREPTKAGVLPEECKALAVSPPDRVVIYSTSWCGVCRAAEAFMKKEGIPFVDKDVEADPAAQKELACKALKAGKRLSGVPVLDIGGELQLGFDRDRLLAAARRLKPPSSPTPGQP